MPDMNAVVLQLRAIKARTHYVSRATQKETLRGNTFEKCDICKTVPALRGDIDPRLIKVCN